jgi:hypothetical protein
MKPPILMDFPGELGTDGEPRDILIYEHREASG